MKTIMKRFIILATSLLYIASTFALPVEAETVYKFDGRGWGHGLGLSQYGAKGFAERGYSTERILRHFYRKTLRGRVNNQAIRVHVAGGKSYIDLMSDSNFYVTDLSTKKIYNLSGKQTYRVNFRNGLYQIYNATTKKVKGNYKGPLYYKPGKSLIRLLSRNDNGVSKVKYRGSLKVKMNNSKFSVINHIPIESYLRGVIPYEMPSSWHMEALKAQTIAARSYALASKKNNGDFDVYSTVYSQVYGGYTAENSRTNYAIRATKGIVRRYNGKVIYAYFFSSSGGRTENNENVWGGSPIAYLRGVVSPYEETNSWTYKISTTSLKDILGNYSSSNTSGVNGSLQDLTVIQTGYSPRVINIKITGSKGISYITGSNLRKLLKMRSTWFSINKE